MTESSAQKYWWIVIVATCAAAVAVLVIVDAAAPGNEIAASLAALALVGAGFISAYVIDRERRWWAIIPGLGALTLLASLLSDIWVGTDPGNDWVNLSVIGIGAVIIGIVLKRIDAKMTLWVVGAFCFGIAFLMSPLSVALKIVLVALDVAVSAYVVYRANAGRPMLSTHGWLHPRP